MNRLLVIALIVLLASCATISKSNISSTKAANENVYVVAAFQQQWSTLKTSHPQGVDKKIVDAAILGVDNNPSLGLRDLFLINPEQLQSNQKMLYYIVQAQLYRAGENPGLAAISFIRAKSTADTSMNEALDEQISSTLFGLDVGTLSLLDEVISSQEERGWVAAAKILAESKYDTNQKSLLLTQWSSTYGSHPANKFLELSEQSSKQQQQITAPVIVEQAKPMAPRVDRSHIAVLLPLSGKFAQLASAVKQGIETSNIADQVVFIDTSEFEPDQVVPSIVASGGVIGPLLKDEVDAYSKALTSNPAALSLPRWIMLNDRPDGHIATSNLYFYSLNPQIEVTQVVKQMNELGDTKPLVVVPSSPIGSRIESGFKNNWPDGDVSVIEVMNNADVVKKLQVKPSSDGNYEYPYDAIYVAMSSMELSFVVDTIESTIDPRADKPMLYLGSRTMPVLQHLESLPDRWQALAIDMPIFFDGKSDAFFEDMNPSEKKMAAMALDAVSALSNLSQGSVLFTTGLQGYTGTLIVEDGDVIIPVYEWRNLAVTQ